MKYSFVNNIGKIWNNLEKYIKEIQSFRMFKKELNKAIKNI